MKRFMTEICAGGAKQSHETFMRKAGDRDKNKKCSGNEKMSERKYRFLLRSMHKNMRNNRQRMF